MHTFSGMEDPVYNLTPDMLRDVNAEENPNGCTFPDLTGEESGLGPIPDKSAYWMPALRSTNFTTTNWITPETVLVYYRNAGIAPADIVPFPESLSLRAGNPSATLMAGGLQPKEHMRWSCVAQSQGLAIPNEVNFGATIPTTCPMFRNDEHGVPNEDNEYFLRLVVFFPSCLNIVDGEENGNGLWKPDDGETSYASEILPVPLGDGVVTRECTTLHHEAIPQVQIGYRWPLTTENGVVPSALGPNLWDLTSLKLASDMGAFQNRGVTGHADFMSGWTEQQLEHLVRVCFTNGPENCGAIGEDPDDPYDEWEN